MPGESKGVFLSYASEDTEAAGRIAQALRSAGIEVWFDRTQLRGGDAWDQSIRRQIRDCGLFIAVVSQNTRARGEGYFRLEWKLAIDRSHLISSDLPFLLPVAIDDTPENDERTPERFREVHWTRLPGGVTPPIFAERVAQLLSPAPAVAKGPGHARSSLSAASDPPVATSARNRGSRLVPLVMAALALLGVGYFAWERIERSKHSAASTSGETTAGEIPEKSIAVLPFADLSENHDQEYFSDGMTEEILDLLVKVPGLKVIGRTSSFQFKGKSDDLRKIGIQLGAAYIVEGSVRRTSDRIRVSAELIESRTGSRRWSETYDRASNGTPQLQLDVASGISRALQLEVAGLEASPTDAGHRNPQAYDLYLRGLHAHERFDQSGFEEAIVDLQRALDLDPSFVRAAEALAFTLRDQANWEYVASTPAWERTRAASMRAISLDHSSALAHAVLGDVHTEYDWDWPAAEQELNTAQTLAPGNPLVLQLAGVERLAVGQWAEAVRLFNAELSVDPLDPSAKAFRAWAYARLGRYEDAERDQRALLSFSPTFGWAHYYLGIDLLAQGRASEALEEMQKESPASGRVAGLAVAYYAVHRLKEADDALDKLIAEHASDYALMIAEAYAFRHESNSALQWLDRAYAQKDGALYYVKGDPLLRNLESDPRYKAFLRRMNLPE